MYRSYQRKRHIKVGKSLRFPVSAAAKAYAMDITRLKSERISAAFTARHHGNESSSLNFTFRLLDRCCWAIWRRCARKVNVILVPLSNIDGGMPTAARCRGSIRNGSAIRLVITAQALNSARILITRTAYTREARLLGKLWDEYLFDVNYR